MLVVILGLCPSQSSQCREMKINKIMNKHVVRVGLNLLPNPQPLKILHYFKAV